MAYRHSLKPIHVSLNNLQDFVETFCNTEACIKVDLREVAGVAGFRGTCPSVVVDVDSCLSRLYSGYYADWIGGGQWNNVIEYLTLLVQKCRECGLFVVAFFNGAVDGSRFTEWCQRRADECSNVRNITQHIINKATPPPKLWWIPPAFLATAIRLAFVSLGVTVITSVADHPLELVSYCREHNIIGIIGRSAEYLIFGDIRCFSAEKLKLKYSGSIQTEEYVAEGLAKKINCHPQRFCVLAALIGCHLLPFEDLVEFYCRICSLASPVQVFQMPPEARILAVVQYVRSLNSVDDLDFIANDIFRLQSEADDRAVRFKRAVQYFYSGTLESFLKRQSGCGGNIMQATVAESHVTPHANNADDVNHSQQLGAVVAGVYTRDVLLARDLQSAVSNCSHEQTTTVQSVSMPATQQTASAADISTSLLSNSSASQAPATAHVSGLSSPPPPVKAGILPPNVNTNASSSSVVLSVSAADGHVCEKKSPVQAVTQTDRDWTEFKEELSEDFFSFTSPVSTAAVAASSCHQPKDAISSSCNDWKEFEEVLSEEFLSHTPPVSPAAVAVSSCHQPKDAISSSYMTLPLRTPGLIPPRFGFSNVMMSSNDYASLSSGYSSNVPYVPWCDSFMQPPYRLPLQKPMCHVSPGNVEKWWKVDPDIMKTALSRHQAALMCPWVYQLLSHGEILLPVVFESYDLPSCVDIYRPVRQSAYAVLYGFDRSDTKILGRAVKEWLMPVSSSSAHYDSVLVQPLSWDIPSLQQLWLGESTDDRHLRMMVLLQCFDCYDDDDNLLLNQTYVPPRFLVLCLVLRLLLRYRKQQILQPNEVDAFLATAVELQCQSSGDLQMLEVPVINVRGVQLAALLMHGVDHAVFVNDVAGSPLPFSLFCPWMFFDGKLFQYKLLKSTAATASLRQLCSDNVERTMCAERMKLAVMKGVSPLSVFAKYRYTDDPVPVNADIRPADMKHVVSNVRRRGALGAAVPQHSGALTVAGVVVGQWKSCKEESYVKVVDHLTARTASPLQPAPVIAAITMAGSKARGKVSNYRVTQGRGRGRGHKEHEDTKVTAPACGFPAALKKPVASGLFSQTYEQRTRSEGRGRGCTVEHTSLPGSVPSSDTEHEAL